MVKRTKSEEEEHRVTLIIISIVLAFTLIALLYFYKDVHINSPELILPILLILGVMALIVTLSYTTAIFHQLGLSDPDRTLGLPEGSMQAIIALSLILIFLISSLLLYEEVADIDVYRSYNVTQAEFDKIPTNQIAFFDRITNANNETSYIIGRYSREKSKSSEDIAKQIITTVSTLVVAVAGFYFGSKTVTEARRAVELNLPQNEGKQEEEKPSADTKQPDTKPMDSTPTDAKLPDTQKEP